MDFSIYKNKFVEKASNNGYSSENIDRCLAYAKTILDNNVPVIYNTSNLSALVGYNKSFLKRASVFTSYFYRSFTIRKKNGGTRSIEEPLPSLKEIQLWILKNILEMVKISSFAKAYKKKTSLIENVRYHKNQDIVLILDIENFFPSITLEKVESVFLNLGYSNIVSNLLAKLCTKSNQLPQGSPTSPYLSNIIFKPLDDIFSQYCIKNDIKYTRYADDLTFSGAHDIDTNSIIKLVSEHLSAHGLSLKKEKSKVFKKNTQQIVTGIVVNEKLQVPFDTRNNIRQELHYIKIHGPEGHKNFKKIKKKNYLSHLLGKINFILMINPNDNEFIEYKSFLIKLRKEHPLV